MRLVRCDGCQREVNVSKFFLLRVQAVAEDYSTNSGYTPADITPNAWRAELCHDCAMKAVHEANAHESKTGSM